MRSLGKEQLPALCLCPDDQPRSPVGIRRNLLRGFRFNAIGRPPLCALYQWPVPCRTGTLFEGRFKSSLVDSECYLLTCMRYVELNPVRADMVTKPEDYRWSSHRHPIAVSTIDWLSEPEEYRRLAAIPKACAQAYQELFKQALSTHELEVFFSRMMRFVPHRIIRGNK